MLDIKFIRENVELIKQNCINRQVKVDIDLLISTDNLRRQKIQTVEILKSELNKKSKNKPSAEEIIKLKTMGDEIKKIELELKEIEIEFKKLLLQIPNLTHPSTPIGGEDDYKVVFINKEPKKFDFLPLDHEKLMLKNDLIDLERATKVAGSKFVFLKNNLLKMNSALINYGLDKAIKYNYIPVETPDLAKDEILTGAGFSPRGDETQIYSIENSNLSLIGTAEITMGGYHANEILDLTNGPKKYIALSHCFRTEAGSYGRTSKGLYRMHQFTKLEMFIFCKPKDSEKYHQEILEIEKEIIDGLDLPYRVIDIASGDLGGPAYKKYDIEVWMTMNALNEKEQGGYGEVTSCSNCTDYQARRLNIKYRKENGELDFVHTLNGTAIVLSRFPLAIVENYQQKDGTINIPVQLQKYCQIEKL